MSVHGTDGPIHVTDGTHRGTDSENDWLQAAKQIGWDEVTDIQSLDHCNGFERWKRTVSPEGKRQDTAHAYVHNKLRSGKYPNLHVLVESKVVRVLLDDEKRAVGVEYTPNPELQTTIGTTQHPKLTVKARKLVVVSAGACGTPPVLERSGIGSPEILKRAGVDVLVDLPGVGTDYQDHQLVLYPWRTALKPEETIDELLRSPERRKEMIENKDKRLGWNSIDISSKLRPTEEEVTALGPEFRAAWDKDFKNAPNRPVTLMATVAW